MTKNTKLDDIDRALGDLATSAARIAIEHEAGRIDSLIAETMMAASLEAASQEIHILLKKADS